MQEALSFDKVMRGQSLEMLKTLERWVERQATGLDMAANPDALKQSFDKLLKVSILKASLAPPRFPYMPQEAPCQSRSCHMQQSNGSKRNAWLEAR